MDIIKMILGSPVGSLGFVVGIMLGAGWLIYFVTKKVTEIQKEHEHMQGNAGKLENTIDRRFGMVETHIDEMRKDLSYLKGSIELIRSGANQPTKSRSPISLTEVGIKIAEELKVEELVAQNWDKIAANMDANVKDKNAYDIQTYCMETAAVDPESFFDDATIHKLKAYAFKNGNSLFYYSGVFGVVIRDKYLQQKGIDVSEVDVNDPAKH